VETRRCAAITHGGSALFEWHEAGSHSVRAADDRQVLGQLDVESIAPAPKRSSQRCRISSNSGCEISCALRPAGVGRTTQSLRSPRALPHPSRSASDCGFPAGSCPTTTYRHRSIPPSVESIRAFGSPATIGSSPTVIPSPTKRMKFDHITSDATRAPPPACANRPSNSLSNSIVNATSARERRVESGTPADMSLMLRLPDLTDHQPRGPARLVRLPPEWKSRRLTSTSGPGEEQIERADARTRTGDPFITSEVLYQLSYVGEDV